MSNSRNLADLLDANGDVNSVALDNAPVSTAQQTALNLKPQTNDIINGQFRVAQAGVSFAAPAASDYDLDGWMNSNSSTAVYTVAQDAGSSTGKFSRSITVTTAAVTIASTDHASTQVRLEGYDSVKYIGNTYTLGFRVKSSVVGIHCVSVYDGTSTMVVEYTIDVADTWEHKTITIIGGLQTVSSDTNSWGILTNFSHGSGADHQTTSGTWQAGHLRSTANQVNDMATVGNVFALEDVTMNLGTTVAADTATYEQDLAKCQRYYFNYDAAGETCNIHGALYSGSTYIAEENFPVEMRSIPSMSIVFGTGTPASLQTQTTRFIQVFSTASSYIKTYKASARL
jgi:hypothetical protein